MESTQTRSGNQINDLLEKLTPLQRQCINISKFVEAYNIVVSNECNYNMIIDYITNKLSHCPQIGCTHEAADMLRYCRLILRIM